MALTGCSADPRRCRAEDCIIRGKMADADLARFMETYFAHQPAGALMSTWLGRRLFSLYYMRILTHVMPRRGFLWPTQQDTAISTNAVPNHRR